MNFKGYHGTGRKTASEIKNQGFNFKQNMKFPNDLGDGVYFFIQRNEIDFPEKNAKNYVYSFKSEERLKSLLIAEISIDDDKLLDLNEEEIQTEFDSIRNEYLDKIKTELKKYPDTWGAKQRGNYDGIVLNILLESRNMKPDGVLKDTYTPFLDFKSEKNSGYRISNFPNGRELCVRNIDTITKITSKMI
ncbi:hypothetical protein [Lactococcus petauri]